MARTSSNEFQGTAPIVGQGARALTAARSCGDTSAHMSRQIVNKLGNWWWRNS
jgi:hypothetical protein